MGCAGDDMSDLSKMDPMALKLKAEVEAFHKALEDGNPDEARSRITEIQKFADYLSEDISVAIQKTERLQGPNDIYAGGTPVMKFNETQSVFDVSQRNDVLPGTIIPARTGSIMKPWRKV
jgi:hypothetical protein